MAHIYVFRLSVISAFQCHLSAFAFQLSALAVCHFHSHFARLELKRGIVKGQFEISACRACLPFLLAGDGEDGQTSHCVILPETEP